MKMSDILNDLKPGQAIDLGGATIEPCYERGRVFDEPVVMRNAIFDAGSNNARAFRFDNCRGIGFEHIELRGLDRTSTGFMFSGCTDISVSRMLAHGLKSAITINRCDGFVPQESQFTNIRKDAFTSGGSRRVSVLRNYGTNFSPINTGGAGDHPDFIQFWPLYGNDNSFIDIEHNYFERGDGLPVQGGFVRGIYEKDGVPYRPQFGEVNMRRNIIVGALYNGISVSGVNAGEIVDNVVVSARDAAGNLIDKHSWLRADRCAPTVTIARNRAEAFIGDVDETLNTRAVVQHWPKAPQIDCGLRSGLPDPVEPPARSKPQGPDAQQGGTAVEQLRQKLAARDRMIDERFASAENLFDQLRYHRDERRKEVEALNEALGHFLP